MVDCTILQHERAILPNDVEQRLIIELPLFLSYKGVKEERNSGVFWTASAVFPPVLPERHNNSSCSVALRIIASSVTTYNPTIWKAHRFTLYPTPVTSTLRFMSSVIGRVALFMPNPLLPWWLCYFLISIAKMLKIDFGQNYQTWGNS